jgi:hypothetical protein
MRTPILVAATAILALVVAACGTAATPTPSPSPSPSPTPTAVCAALDSLQASIGAVNDVDPLKDGIAGYVTALAAVRSDLTALRAAAGGQLSSETDALETAIADLQGTLDSVGSGSLGGALKEIGDRLATLGSALTDLRTSAASAFAECQAN